MVSQLTDLPLIYTVARVVNRLEGRKVSSETEAHEGPVYAVYAYPSPDGSGTCLITGGGDGKVKTWDSEVCDVFRNSPPEDTAGRMLQ